MDLIEVSENPNRHPWELSRTSCIIQVLRSLNIHGNILDIGCGDSYFDHNLLKEDPELCIYGVDIFLKDEDEIASTVTKGWFKSSLKSSMPTYPVAPIIPTLDILAPPFFHL